jgi:hypothetical protein
MFVRVYRSGRSLCQILTVVPCCVFHVGRIGCIPPLQQALRAVVHLCRYLCRLHMFLACYLAVVTAMIFVFWRSGHLREEFVGPVWCIYARAFFILDVLLMFAYMDLVGPGQVYDPLGRHPGGGRRIRSHNRCRQYAWARVLEMSVR